MRSTAFALNGEVWMKLATSADGRRVQECCFDTVEVAEALGLAILRAAVRAREQQKSADKSQPPLY